MDSAGVQLVDAPPTGGSDSPGVRPTGARHRPDVALRVVCHLAAELPVVLFGAVELARGWRPLDDNAALALRSWQVFGSPSPLVGHQMAVTVGGHAVFGPGPLESWILAVPVRIDPGQGALWGAVLAVVVAIALAVEASWAAGGWPAGTTTAAAVLVLALARPELALDVVWNVWFALFFLVAAFCSALAVATGRLRWWPVTVVAASVVVQCQVAYAPPAVAVAGLAPLVGLAVRHRRHEAVGGLWWVVGLVVGGIVWLLPAVQEVTTDPGNLTLLVRSADGASGATVGTRSGLRALGGATRVPPDWVHPLPGGGAVARFFGEADLINGPEWWALVVLGLLVGVAVVAWRRRHSGLAAMAGLTLGLALGAVATVAAVPLQQFPVIGYLGAVLVPVGIAVWVTLVWAFAVGVRARVQPWPTGAGPGRDPAAGSTPLLRWMAGAVLVGLGSGLVVLGLGQMDGPAPTLSGWTSVRETDAATTAALSVAPRGSFGLEVGPAGPDAFAVLVGTAFELVARGDAARPTAAVAFPTFGRPPRDGPTVLVTLAGPGRATARVLWGRR